MKLGVLYDNTKKDLKEPSRLSWKLGRLGEAETLTVLE